MSYHGILVILMLASTFFAQISINIEDDKRLFKVENATLHESLVDDITFQALLKNAIYRTPDKEKAHQKLTNLIEQKVYCFYFPFLINLKNLFSTKLLSKSFIFLY